MFAKLSYISISHGHNGENQSSPVKISICNESGGTANKGGKSVGT